MIRKKNIDFIRAARRSGSRSYKAVVGQILIFFLPVLSAGWFLFDFTYTAWLAETARNREDQIRTYLDSRQMKDRLTEASQLQIEGRRLGDLQARLETVKEVQEDTEEISGEQLLCLNRCLLFGNISEIQFEKGELRFEAVTEDYENIRKMLGELKNAGLFDEIVYNGYLRESAENGGYLYRFQLSCNLKSEEGVQ